MISTTSSDLREPAIDVVCTGDPRSQGLAQGEQLRSRVAHALDVLPELEAVRVARPRLLPMGMFLRLAEGKIRRRWLRAALGRDAGMSDRIEGIARGAGFRAGRVQLLNALEALLSSVEGRAAVAPPLGACSALAVRGHRAAGGEPVIARNFDYLPITRATYMFRDSRPSAGLRALEFTLAPLAGTVDGINEAGLAVAYNYGFAVDPPSFGPTISMVIQRVLATCRSVSEACEELTTSPRWGGGLLMLADAEGDLASVELASSRHSVRRPAPGEDIIFHTNEFRTAEVQAVEVDRRAVFLPTAPPSLVGRRVLASSEERYRRFEALVGHGEPLGEDDLTRIMSDHGEAGEGTDETLCVHSSYWFTTATMQYYPRSRRVRVAYDTACRASYHDLAL